MKRTQPNPLAYDQSLRSLANHVHPAVDRADFQSEAAALHALFEVAAQHAVASGFDFEDYLRAAMCAYDCHHHRSLDHDRGSSRGAFLAGNPKNATTN